MGARGVDAHGRLWKGTWGRVLEVVESYPIDRTPGGSFELEHALVSDMMHREDDERCAPS
jgi:hypothetical protein